MPATNEHPTTATDDATRIASSLATIVRRARLAEVHGRVARAAGIDLDRAGYAVLTHVRDWQPLRISTLAARLDVSLPTASRHVARLEEAGHLVRTTDPGDARACRVSLTPEGAAVVEQIARARTHAVAELLTDWPERDRAELARLLDALVETLTARDA